MSRRYNAQITNVLKMCKYLNHIFCGNGIVGCLCSTSCDRIESLIGAFIAKLYGRKKQLVHVDLKNHSPVFISQILSMEHYVALQYK